MQFKMIMVTLLSLVLVGCGGTSALKDVKQVSVIEKEIRAVIYHPDINDNAILPPKDITVQVLTEKEAQKKIETGTFEVIYGFNEFDYLKVSQYLEDLKARLSNLKNIITYYRELPMLNPVEDTEEKTSKEKS